jgi:hypothetical protein
MHSRPTIPFVDLRPALGPIRAEIDAAIAAVNDSTIYLRGPQAAAFGRAGFGGRKGFAASFCCSRSSPSLAHQASDGYGHRRQNPFPNSAPPAQCRLARSILDMPGRGAMVRLRAKLAVLSWFELQRR